MRTQQDDPVQQYITSIFIEKDDVKSKAWEKGELLQPGMQIGPAEGKLLYVLAKLVHAKRILEIGTFVGYSTLWLAEALPEEGSLMTLESNDDHANLAELLFKQAGMDEKIEICRGPALETLRGMTEENIFDLVFIDASKREYAQYLDKVEPMVRPGGLIIGDNSLLFGAMTGEPRQKVSWEAKEAMQAFNKRLADPKTYASILIPTEEGMTVAQKLPFVAEGGSVQDALKDGPLPPPGDTQQIL